MMTYCPACGTNVLAATSTSEGRQRWQCTNCNMVLKETAAPARQAAAPAPRQAPVAPPGPVVRQSTGVPAAAAPPPAAPPKLAPTAAGAPSRDQVLGRIAVVRMSAAEASAAKAEAEKRAAEQAARLAAIKPILPVKTPEPAPKPQAEARPTEIELEDGDPGEFVLEGAGGERKIGDDGAGEAASSEPGPSGSRESLDLDDGAGAFDFGAADPPSEPVPAAASPALFERVVVADDTALLRQILKDALEHHSICREVGAYATGDQFLGALTGHLARRERVDLAILDVELPLLNGYSAAIALRAVEKALRVQTPTPILFFTSHACDDTFRKVLEYCQPARHFLKGAEPVPNLVARLAQALTTMKRA